MDKQTKIPQALIQEWELEALSQKLPYTELKSFIQMKENNFRQSIKIQKPRIFANAAHNKLTEYGNKVAIKYLTAIPVIERICKFAKDDLDDLEKKLAKGFEDETQKENFILDRDQWFLRLKEKMKEYKISKETLASYNLDWKLCKRFAFQAV